MNFSSSKNKEADQLYQWLLCVFSISVVLVHLLPSDQSVQTSTKLFQGIENVCSNNTLCNVEKLLSIYYSISCSCTGCYIFYLFEQCFIQQIRSSSLPKSRVSNFTLSFPRVYRGPVEVIVGIFGRTFPDSWRSPIGFCIRAYFFLLF